MNEQQQSAGSKEELVGISWWERANGLWQQANVRGLQVALGTGLSVVFLWLAFRNVPLAQDYAASQGNSQTQVRLLLWLMRSTLTSLR